MVGTLSYGALNDSAAALAFGVLVAIAVSAALFLLARGGSVAISVAVVAGLAWLVFLLPDVQYYLATRRASPDSLVEPFDRHHYVRAYILVFMPVAFLLLSLILRRRTI